MEPDDITVFYVTANDYPILFAHGLFPLSGRFDPHRLKDVSVEQLAFQSLGSAVVNGNRCVVLRASPVKGQSDSYDEFWIDPNRESSVVRWFRYVNQGKVFARLDIESVETSDGWLPRSWSTCFYHTPVAWNKGPRVPLGQCRYRGLGQP